VVPKIKLIDIADRAMKFRKGIGLSLQEFVNNREKETLSQAMSINF